MRRAAALTRTTHRVDDALDERARFAGRVDRQLRADQLDHVGAGERGLVDVRGHRAPMRPRSQHGAARAPQALGTRSDMVRVAVQLQAARIGAPLLLERRPGQRLGLGGRVAFCAVASCAAVGSPSTTTRLCRAHSPQPGRALRPRLDGLLGDPGDLRHPGVRVDRVPLEAALGVQLWRSVA